MTAPAAALLARARARRPERYQPQILVLSREDDKGNWIPTEPEASPSSIALSLMAQGFANTRKETDRG